MRNFPEKYDRIFFERYKVFSNNFSMSHHYYKLSCFVCSGCGQAFRWMPVPTRRCIKSVKTMLARRARSPPVSGHRRRCLGPSPTRENASERTWPSLHRKARWTRRCSNVSRVKCRGGRWVCRFSMLPLILLHRFQVLFLCHSVVRYLYKLSVYLVFTLWIRWFSHSCVLLSSWNSALSGFLHSLLAFFHIQILQNFCVVLKYEIGRRCTSDFDNAF